MALPRWSVTTLTTEGLWTSSVESIMRFSVPIPVRPLMNGSMRSSSKSFYGLFDPLVVGGDQDLRHRSTSRRLFIHVLNHGLPTEHDEGFSSKARRPVPGRDHHHDGWCGLSHC